MCRCGSQAGEYRSGISKKNNKPWKGWKCSQCGEMIFLKTEAPKAQPSSGGDFKQIVSLLEDIKALLCAKLMGATPKVAPNTVKKAVKAPVDDADGIPFPDDEDAPF